MSKTFFTTKPVSGTDTQLLIKNTVDAISGVVQDSVCYCHKVTPYPVQKAGGFAGPQIVYERMPCSTQCLRATIVKGDKEDVPDIYRMDCEANILELPINERQEVEPKVDTSTK